MPRKMDCTFCGEQIEPGTGKMYVKKGGAVLYFCSSKCEKNMMVLKRKPRTTTWTQKYKAEKQQRLKK
ncbi:MAG: 50S ribosomal protein L24e [Candidatus Methanofastidiosia archaeon]